MIFDDYEVDLQSGTSEFRRVRGPTVPEVVAGRMRDAILAGRYVPGERLVEQKLAGLFGIGQPTVREALRELELQGFVRKRGNRGTYVTEFSTEDVVKRHEVRLALEGVAISRAAALITEEDEAQLKELLVKMGVSAERFDRASFHKLDMAFHRKIWACADNEYLALVLERVTFSLFAFQLLARTHVDPVMKRVTQQHWDILNALLTRNPVFAREEFLRTIVLLWPNEEQASGASL